MKDSTRGDYAPRDPSMRGDLAHQPPEGRLLTLMRSIFLSSLLKHDWSNGCLPPRSTAKVRKMVCPIHRGVAEERWHKGQCEFFSESLRRGIRRVRHNRQRNWRAH